MRPDSAEWHKARIQLEGNPVFQSMRLEVDTLREQRAELIEALRATHQILGDLKAAQNYPERIKQNRALLARLESA